MTFRFWCASVRWHRYATGIKGLFVVSIVGESIWFILFINRVIGSIKLLAHGVLWALYLFSTGNPNSGHRIILMNILCENTSQRDAYVVSFLNLFFYVGNEHPQVYLIQIKAIKFVVKQTRICKVALILMFRINDWSRNCWWRVVIYYS